MAHAVEAPDTALREAIKDVLFALALIATGGFALFWILRTPAGFGSSSSPIGFDTLPIVASVLLMLLAGIYLVGRLVALVAAARATRRWAPRLLAPTPVIWQRLATVTALVLYVLSLRHVPFYAATFGLLAVMFVVYGQRSPLVVLGVALVGSAALTGLFVHALRLPI